jgi:anhydro-N-acetylmuramic acid kinase
MRVLGLATGASFDAIDLAVLETDGEAVQGFGPAGEREMSDPASRLLREAAAQASDWTPGSPEPELFDLARRAIAQEQLSAAEAFLREHGLGWDDLDGVGVHGRSLSSGPTEGSVGKGVQLIDPARIAHAAGVAVVWDFVDTGARPLALYHLARVRASGLEPPLAVIDVGPVAGLTLVGRQGMAQSFDAGAGTALLDRLVQARGLGRFDEGGLLAAAGRTDPNALARLLEHQFFSDAPGACLNRDAFSLHAVETLADADAAATLVAFIAAGVKRGFDLARERPKAAIVCGGGRRNPEIMLALQAALPVPVSTAEVFGWRGDALDAEAFAFLAARTMQGLPVAFPGTSPAPASGGRIARP